MSNKTTNEKTKGIIRHLLTLIGGILITLGIVSAEDVDLLVTAVLEIVGAAFTLWGVIASWLNKDRLVDGDT